MAQPAVASRALDRVGAEPARARPAIRVLSKPYRQLAPDGAAPESARTWTFSDSSFTASWFTCGLADWVEAVQDWPLEFVTLAVTVCAVVRKNVLLHRSGDAP